MYKKDLISATFEVILNLGLCTFMCIAIIIFKMCKVPTYCLWHGANLQCGLGCTITMSIVLCLWNLILCWTSLTLMMETWYCNCKKSTKMLSVPSRIWEAECPCVFPRGSVFILWLLCIETDARPLAVLMSYHVGSTGCTDISKRGGRSASLATLPAWLQQWIVWEVSLFSTCLNPCSTNFHQSTILICLTILHVMGHLIRLSLHYYIVPHLCEEYLLIYFYEIIHKYCIKLFFAILMYIERKWDVVLRMSAWIRISTYLYSVAFQVCNSYHEFCRSNICISPLFFL